MTLASVSGGNHNLTLNNSGLATLGGAVSGVRQFNIIGAGSLTVNNPISAASVTDNEVTTLNAAGSANSPSILTAGGQTYNRALTLSQNTVLADSASANIVFNSTVDGARSLAVNTLGNEIFNERRV